MRMLVYVNDCNLAHVCEVQKVTHNFCPSL